jgi:predicted  nucleic acid-binding Zn-ribbon protein
VKTDLEARIGVLESERVQANDKLVALNTKFSELQKLAEQLSSQFEAAKTKARQDYEDKILELEAAISQKEEIQQQKQDQTLSAKDPTALNKEKEALQLEIAQLKAQITTLKQNEEEMIANVLAALSQLKPTPTELGVEAEATLQESMRARLAVLQSILDKHPDREDIKQMVTRLEAGVVMPESDSETVISEDNELSFADDLRKLLLQTALLDSEDETALLPEEVLEPVKEKLCLLLVFVELFYKQLNKYVAENIVKYKQKNPRITPNNIRQLDSIPKLVQNIDHLLIGDIEDAQLWSKITTVGEIINGLLNTGLLPDTPELYSKMTSFDKKAGAVHDLFKLSTKFLPDSNKIIKEVTVDGQKEYKIVEKMVGDKSYTELPILYLLQMKLLSRYTEYILKKAPNKLECPVLGLMTEQF